MKLRILFERWALREGFDVAGRSEGTNGVKTFYYDDALNGAWQRVVGEAASTNLAAFDNSDEEWFPIETCPVGVVVCLRSSSNPAVRAGYVETASNDSLHAFFFTLPVNNDYRAPRIESPAMPTLSYTATTDFICVKAGDTVFPYPHNTYGVVEDDEEALGTECVAVTQNADGSPPFLVIPLHFLTKNKVGAQ